MRIQSTDTGKLDKEERSRGGNAWIPLGRRNRIDFMDRLGVYVGVGGVGIGEITRTYNLPCLQDVLGNSGSELWELPTNA